MDEIMRHLESVAARYHENEFRLFEDELGWETWMEEFTLAEDGETISWREAETIHEIVRKAWEKVHSPC